MRAEIARHSPFTLLGALSGIVIVLVLAAVDAPASLSQGLFWTLHPIHVLLSALTTASMYRLHRQRRGVLSVFVVGYLGSVGIATLSDSIIPFVGEILLDMPNRGVHLGFIEKWWLVNPLAIAGVALSYARATTTIPHAGHVLLSTWASLFHMTMANGATISVGAILVIVVFLFLAVWVPCCTSDIVFPVLMAGRDRRSEGGAAGDGAN
ncbi:MAG: hypothetical protein KDA33_06545 [Phycisphaerales bacterium]|nr:hypothetical protein [Phycisphaerales bacterium]